MLPKVQTATPCQLLDKHSYTTVTHPVNLCIHIHIILYMQKSWLATQNKDKTTKEGSEGEDSGYIHICWFRLVLNGFVWEEV